jgi:hypothetical protein
MPRRSPPVEAVKSWLRATAPWLYRALVVVKTRVTSEVRIALGLAASRLRRRPDGDTTWREVLPLQRPSRIELPGLQFGDMAELAAGLRAGGYAVSEGQHAIYLPPATLQRPAFRVIASRYPLDAGLKLVRNPGGPAEGQYLRGPQQSALHRLALDDHPRLFLLVCLLHAEGLGPQPYDLVELVTAGRAWTGYVLRHVEGRTPTPDEHDAGIARLRALETRGVIEPLLPGGWGHEDFASLDCNGNALTEAATGAFSYVDFQSFRLTGYAAHLDALAVAANAATHFGDESLLRGGRYLYQSIPGVPRPARRHTEARMAVLTPLLDDGGVALDDRLVLDVGCNLGMTCGQYLSLGARWVHGWDMPEVVAHARGLLLALGCTRVSLTGAVIARDRPLPDDVPELVRPRLPGCVVSYLAVREHLGWLDALRDIPWRHLVYEGHEGEGQRQLELDLADLAALTPCRVAGAGHYQDGDSGRRWLALVERQG